MTASVKAASACSRASGSVPWARSASTTSGESLALLRASAVWPATQKVQPWRVPATSCTTSRSCSVSPARALICDSVW